MGMYIYTAALSTIRYMFKTKLLLHIILLYTCTDLYLYITANEAVPGCSVKNLKEDDMHKDEAFERLLMCNIFHSCMCGLPILKQTSLSATTG